MWNKDGLQSSLYVITYSYNARPMHLDLWKLQIFMFVLFLELYGIGLHPCPMSHDPCSKLPTRGNRAYYIVWC